MEVVRHAKYVGTMIGPDGHIRRWSAAPEKIIQRVLKINASTKSVVERLCDFKIYAISVLSFFGSRVRTQQGNPQGREPCPSVYNCRIVILLSAFPRASTLLFRPAMASPTSSVSTASSFGEYFAYNMWNPLLELLFLEQT